MNRFLQPDSIIPDLSNPQYLNRYSYVLNNPILYNDPDGHYAIPVILIPVTVVALVFVGATYYYSQPQVQAAGRDLITQLKGWNKKGTTSNEKQSESIQRSQSNSGDNYLGPGYDKNPDPIICGWRCWTIRAAFIAATARLLYCFASEEECIYEPDLVPASTLTPTIIQAPTDTPMPTLSPTNTSVPPTSTPTSTPSSPVITPVPSYPSGDLPIPI